MFAEISKPKQAAFSKEDPVREYMLSNNITYEEAKRIVENNQKTLFNFRKKTPIF